MNNKALAHRWFDVLWNQKNPDVIAELMDPSAQGVTEGGVISGPDAFRHHVFEPMFAAFPDLHVEFDGILGEGDEVVVRWTAKATHQGNLLHLAASRQRVRFSGMTWLKFRDGKIISGVDRYNLHGLFTFLSTGAECGSVRGF